MSVAFLILNHRRPEQLGRLLSTLRSQCPDSPIAVHHDIHATEAPTALIESLPNVHLLTSGKRVVWGGSGIAEAYCWSLAWMFEHLDFDWVMLISAQDYPIKPLSGLEGDLGRDGADAVFQAVPISQIPTTVERINMRHRYHYQYRPTVASRPRFLSPGVQDFLRAMDGAVVALNLAQPLFKIYRLPDRIPYRFGWRARRTPYSADWPCWKGSSWFALSRRALGYVLRYMAERPEYVEYCRRTMHSDESMVATIVCNSADLTVANRDVTYTRWENERAGHPDLFTIDDLADLLSAPQYFARKFDIAKDSRILDELDKFISHPAAARAEG